MCRSMMAIHSTNDLVKAALAYPPRSGNAHPLYLRRVDALLRLTQPSGPQTREHDLTSVTVAAPSTMDADVWSTALMVLGTDAGEALARNQGVAAYFITETCSGFMSCWTPAMAPWMV